MRCCKPCHVFLCAIKKCPVHYELYYSEVFWIPGHDPLEYHYHGESGVSATFGLDSLSLRGKGVGVSKEPWYSQAREQQECEDILKKVICRVARRRVEGTGVRWGILLTNLSSLPLWRVLPLQAAKHSKARSSKKLIYRVCQKKMSHSSKSVNCKPWAVKVKIATSISGEGRTEIVREGPIHSKSALSQGFWAFF